MRSVMLCLALLLPGCALFPEADHQLRVTEYGSAADVGLLVPASAAAQGCIVSVVDKLPSGLCVRYEGERRSVTFGKCDAVEPE